MKILVIGASRGTGACCVKSALSRGHSVSAFSRNPSKLDIMDVTLTKIAGDFHDPDAVRGAVVGQDAVIICAAPKPSVLKDIPDYFSRGTKYCIEAMREHGVKRLIILSAYGVGDSGAAAGWVIRTVFIDRLMRDLFHDHDVQERMTRESGLDFVIARPTRLTNGEPKGKYTRTAELVSVPLSIARDDLADFMVEACESTVWVGKTVQLGG